MPFGINHLSPVLFGANMSLRTGMRLREMGVTKALFVYDQGVKKAGIPQKIIANADALGIKTFVYEGVLPDPPDYTIDEATEIGRREKVDAVIGSRRREQHGHGQGRQHAPEQRGLDQAVPRVRPLPDQERQAARSDPHHRRHRQRGHPVLRVDRLEPTTRRRARAATSCGPTWPLSTRCSPLVCRLRSPPTPAWTPSPTPPRRFRPARTTRCPISSA